MDNDSPIITSSQGSNTNVFLLIILLLIVIFVICLCCGGSLLFLSSAPRTDVQNKVTPSITIEPEEITPEVTEESEQSIFQDGEDYPPTSKIFQDKVESAKRLLNTDDGYSVITNAIGNPAFSFSMIVDESWKKTKRDTDTYIFETDTSDLYAEYGIAIYDKNHAYMKMSCEEMVKKMFSDEEYKYSQIKVTEKNINNDKWTRVEYKVEQDGYMHLGIDQCIKRKEGVIDHFIYADEKYFNENKETLVKMMDDIYVSEKPIKW